MELVLASTKFDDVATEGMISVVGSSLRWYTLELPYTDGLPGSAIPAGRFPVVLSPSVKFLNSSDSWVWKYAHLMPHIIDIPWRSLIMFHWGNSVKDTEGCILIGKTQGVDFIGHSRPAFEEFYSTIQAVAKANDCFVTVKRQ